MMYDETELQYQIMDSLHRLYLGDITEKVKVADSSLTSSSSDSDWLKAALKVISYEHPGETNRIYTGVLSPNSKGYFEVMVYSTAALPDGTGSYVIPKYCCGTWRKWQNVLAIFSTNNGTFSYTAK